MTPSRARYLLLAAGLTACAGSPPPPAPVPELPANQVVARLYLIGDAGAPRPGGEPVLEALRRDLAAGSGEAVVVFLGDNIYPRGLPPPEDAERAEAERRILDQVQVVTGARVKGYFVPGNHDWARHDKDGWDATLRQERFIDSVGQGLAVLEPRGGCPGPAVVDVGERVRLLLLDTQWWLHSGPRPMDPSSACPADSESEIIDSIRSALQLSGNRVVVAVAHHPLGTGGVHGGYFGWEDHIFPLRQIDPDLWLPLPLIGSLYPAARQGGVSSQDIPSRRYQRLIAAFRRAFVARSPALYAAGHDHNLQVIAGGPVRLELVSGAGIYGHSGRATRIRGTLFAQNASGFARLDVPASGRSRLEVLQVDSTGQGHEVFSTWVE